MFSCTDRHTDRQTYGCHQKQCPVACFAPHIWHAGNNVNYCLPVIIIIIVGLLVIISSLNVVCRTVCMPEGLRAVDDPVEFRKQLKTHFFTAAHNVYWYFLSWIFNERVHVYIRYMSSPVRLSVVCRLSVTLAINQAIEIFRNVLRHLIRWPSVDIPGKILRRSSQGNSSVGGVKHKRGSRI